MVITGFILIQFSYQVEQIEQAANGICAGTGKIP